VFSESGVFAEMSIGNEKCLGRSMEDPTHGKKGELVLVNADLNCVFQDLACCVFELFLHSNHSLCEGFTTESFPKLIDKQGKG